MMKVVAMKLTKDTWSTKVIYEKNGDLYIRTGADKFISGKRLQAPLRSYFTKWGFKGVQGEPEFRDGQEILDALSKQRFAPTGNGKVNFS